jgi:hypothetical protein
LHSIRGVLRTVRNEYYSKDERAEYPAPHRGRDGRHNIKNNRAGLMEAKISGSFWRAVKRVCDPAPTAISVMAHDLREVFEKRLNPSETLPQSFDGAQHKMNKLLAALIPNFPSAKFTEENMEWLNHLRKTPMDSASGEDGIAYADIIGIPNDELVFLFNESIRNNNGPTVVFRSIIIGLLKRGKSASSPGSYRIIALESCILKLLTLLIHKRITD